MTGWTNRGLWDPNTSSTGHKINSCASGIVQMLMKDFLNGNGDQSINPIAAEDVNAPKYNLFGHTTSRQSKGEIYIQNGKKTIN